MRVALFVGLAFVAACDSRGMGGGWSAGSQSAGESATAARKREAASIREAVKAVGRLDDSARSIVVEVSSKRGRRAVVDRVLARTAKLKAKERERAIATLIAIPDDWPRAKKRRGRLRGILVALAKSDFAKKRHQAFEGRCKEAEALGPPKVAWCTSARKRLAEQADKARFKDALALLAKGEADLFVEAASRVEGKARVAKLWAKALRHAKSVEKTAPETAFAITAAYPPNLKDAAKARKLAEALRPFVRLKPPAPTQLADSATAPPPTAPASALLSSPSSSVTPWLRGESSLSAPAPASASAPANVLASPVAQAVITVAFISLSMGGALFLRRRLVRRAAARHAQEEEFTVRSFELAVSHARCLVCGQNFDLNARPVACARCGTAHHAECWAYNRACAVYGCSSREAA